MYFYSEWDFEVWLGGTWTSRHLVIEAVRVAVSAAFEDLYDVGVTSFGMDFEYAHGISPKIMYCINVICFLLLSTRYSCSHSCLSYHFFRIPQGYGDEENFLPKCTITDNLSSPSFPTYLLRLQLPLQL